MNRTLCTRTLKDAALLAAAFLFLALLPSCNTVAGFGKDIQAIAGGGQDIVDDVSGSNQKRAEAY